MKAIMLSLILVSAFAQFSLAQSRMDYSLKTLEGQEVRMKDFYQKGPTLVTFWALWCVPCKQELHALQGIYTKYSGRK